MRDNIQKWWERIGCLSDPGAYTGEESARDSEIAELRDEIAIIERRLEIAESVISHERAKNQHLLDVLMSVYNLAPSGRVISLPDGRVLGFNDPNAAETLNALGRAIHAIPEKIARNDA